MRNIHLIGHVLNIGYESFASIFANGERPNFGFRMDYHKTTIMDPCNTNNRVASSSNGVFSAIASFVGEHAKATKAQTMASSASTPRGNNVRNQHFSVFLHVF